MHSTSATCIDNIHTYIVATKRNILKISFAVMTSTMQSAYNTVFICN
jgi:hypothetical protein